MKKYRRAPSSFFLAQNKQELVFGSPSLVKLLDRDRSCWLCTYCLPAYLDHSTGMMTSAGDERRLPRYLTFGNLVTLKAKFQLS